MYVAWAICFFYACAAAQAWARRIFGFEAKANSESRNQTTFQETRQTPWEAFESIFPVSLLSLTVRSAGSPVPIEIPVPGEIVGIQMMLTGADGGAIQRPYAAVTTVSKTATELQNPSGQDYLAFLHFSFWFDTAVGRTLGAINQYFPIPRFPVAAQRQLFLCVSTSSEVIATVYMEPTLVIPRGKYPRLKRARKLAQRKKCVVCCPK